MNAVLSRRMLLQGAGVALSLPWLEAMLPKGLAQTPRPPRRAAFMYIPNGVIQKKWVPPQAGTDWTPSPTLAPLSEIQQDVTVVSGLNRTYAPGTQVHGQACSCWLTSSPATEALDGGFPTNITLDQIIAREIGAETPLASLELSCNDFTDNQESRYFESISWYGPGHAAATEKDPRAVFDRLFGKPEDISRGRGVLDVVLEDAKSLQRRVGKQDRRRLDEYFDSVRTTEKRLERLELAGRTRPAPPRERPLEAPHERGAYIELMGELMILALQSDLTRVATLLVDAERWSSPRMFHGVFDKPQNHHMLTHDRSPESQAKVASIDRFHVGIFASLVKRMSAIREGDSSLLENAVFALGSGLGDGYSHGYQNLPLVIAGKAGGLLQTGRHLHFEQETPLADAWLGVLNALEIRKDRFADSTGVLPGLLKS